MESLAQLALAKREEAQALQQEGGDSRCIEKLLRESHGLYRELSQQNTTGYLIDFIWQGYYLANHLYEEDNFAQARATSLDALSALEELPPNMQKEHVLLHSLLLNQVADILCETDGNTIHFFKEQQSLLSDKLSEQPLHLCALLLDIKRILAIKLWSEDESAAEGLFKEYFGHASQLYNQLGDEWKNELYCASEELADFYECTNRPEQAIPYKALSLKLENHESQH